MKKLFSFFFHVWKLFKKKSTIPWDDELPNGWYEKQIADAVEPINESNSEIEPQIEELCEELIDVIEPVLEKISVKISQKSIIYNSILEITKHKSFFTRKDILKALSESNPEIELKMISKCLYRLKEKGIVKKSVILDSLSETEPVNQNMLWKLTDNYSKDETERIETAVTTNE